MNTLYNNKLKNQISEQNQKINSNTKETEDYYE